MCSACGFLGNPGIRRISPAMATIISAPLLTTISLMWNSKLLTAPYIFGSAEKEYCVLAIQTGNADTHLLYQFDNFAGVETVSHYACPVEVAGYLFYFTFHAIALFVGEGQRFGWFVLDSIYYQIGKVNGSLSSFGKRCSRQNLPQAFLRNGGG